ncbi:MAG: class I SAM-dependent methyltransferase [Candidatus Omnitrophica bacterium]|nr:class I SAM-dependent methyltransferase [Candidatus Omnitrophota bacterium]
MKEGACPVCGHVSRRRILSLRDYETDHQDLFDLYECGQCGLLFVHPQPSFDALRKFYPEFFSCYNENHFPGARLLWQVLRKQEMRRLMRFLPPSGSILDVGCADASFLDMLKGRAAHRYGIEMDDKMAELAASRLGKENIVHGFLETVDAPFRNIDVVRINHVIEHFADPVLALRKINGFLKKGGYVVGETPNVDCLDRHLFGRFWGGYSVPRHLCLFSRRSLEELFRRTGFELIRMEPRLMTLGWSGGLQNLCVHLLNLRPPHTGRFRGYPLFILMTLPFTFLQSLLGKTGVTGFVARRVSS